MASVNKRKGLITGTDVTEDYATIFCEVTWSSITSLSNFSTFLVTPLLISITGYLRKTPCVLFILAVIFFDLIWNSWKTFCVNLKHHTSLFLIHTSWNELFPPTVFYSPKSFLNLKQEQIFCKRPYFWQMRRRREDDSS